jgi:hypothetical protein
MRLACDRLRDGRLARCQLTNGRMDRVVNLLLKSTGSECHDSSGLLRAGSFAGQKYLLKPQIEL